MAEHRVLLVEDDAGARDALGSLLAEEGYVVRTAASGAAALACAHDFAPHTVVCDVCLPDIDGLQVLRAVRAMRPGAFFVILTAGCGSAEAERSLRREADIFLDKPIDLPRFRAILQRTRPGAREPLPSATALN